MVSMMGQAMSCAAERCWSTDVCSDEKSTAEKSEDKSYGKLVKKRNNFHPKPRAIIRTSKLAQETRSQRKMWVKMCNYGHPLTMMLIECMVCDINEDRIQQRLLSQEGLTFFSRTKIWDLLIRSTPKSSTGYGERCYRCGGGNHLAKDCRFTNEKCHNCGKVGYINRACRIKTGVKKYKSEKNHQGQRENLNQEEEDDRDKEDIFTVIIWVRDI